MPCNRYRSLRMNAINAPPKRSSPLRCNVCDRLFRSRQALLEHQNGPNQPRRTTTRVQPLRNPRSNVVEPKPEIVQPVEPKPKNVWPVEPKRENDAPPNPSGSRVASVKQETLTAVDASSYRYSPPGRFKAVKLEAKEEVDAGPVNLLGALGERNSVSAGIASPERKVFDPNVQTPRENNNGDEADSAN